MTLTQLLKPDLMHTHRTWYKYLPAKTKDLPTFLYMTMQKYKTYNSLTGSAKFCECMMWYVIVSPSGTPTHFIVCYWVFQVLPICKTEFLKLGLLFSQTL